MAFTNTKNKKIRRSDFLFELNIFNTKIAESVIEFYMQKKRKINNKKEKTQSYAQKTFTPLTDFEASFNTSQQNLKL